MARNAQAQNFLPGISRAPHLSSASMHPQTKPIGVFVSPAADYGPTGCRRRGVNVTALRDEIHVLEAIATMRAKLAPRRPLRGLPSRGRREC
jgi:hypothetical protein